VKSSLIILTLLISSSARAEMCDMQKHCYPEQPYYDIHGNRVPPPAPQYPQPKPLPVPNNITVQPTINSNICKLARIRVAPEAPQTIIEICTMSNEEERMYRQRQRLNQASIPQMYLPNGDY
jgi:hypothetical protein